MLVCSRSESYANEHVYDQLGQTVLVGGNAKILLCATGAANAACNFTVDKWDQKQRLQYQSNYCDAISVANLPQNHVAKNLRSDLGFAEASRAKPRTQHTSLIMLNRRRMVLQISACALAATGATKFAFANENEKVFDNKMLRNAIAALEKLSGGRLGVAVLDTASGARFQWRGNARFPLCSTFKFILAAAILQRVDQDVERLNRLIQVHKDDLLSNSPVSETFVAKSGATVAQLCEGSMIWSDNTAANLLLTTIGGPAGLTQFIRGLGDSVTRLDRNELDLGECRPGDERDTTTPLAMLAILHKLLVAPDSILTAKSRTQLIDWLVDNRTGDTRLRAGLPETWKVGDKTGAGGHGTNNDVAIVWPPEKPPLLIASYLTECTLDSAGTQGIHAGVAHSIVAAWRPGAKG